MISAMQRNRPHAPLGTTVAALAVIASAVVAPSIASADTTDDYPIPHRMIMTTCTAHQIWLIRRLLNSAEPISRNWQPISIP